MRRISATWSRLTRSTAAYSTSSARRVPHMDDSERQSAGMKVRRRVLGDAHVDRATARASAVTDEFQDLITRYAWGEIWTRPGLDERTRRVLVIGTLVALGRWEEFRMHAAAALH